RQPSGCARLTESEPAPSGSLAHGSSISCCVSHCLLQLLAGGSTSRNEDDPVLLSISSYAESGNRIAPTRAFGRRDSHGSAHDAHRDSAEPGGSAALPPAARLRRRRR